MIFISYSRNDYVDSTGNVIPDNLITTVKQKLDENKFPYWFDENGVRHGDEFVDILTKALDECDIFIAILTESSCKSDWVYRELSCAIDQKKLIIPIKAVDKYPIKISFLLSTYNYIDHFNSPGTTISKLLDRLNEIKKEKETEAEKNRVDENAFLEETYGNLIASKNSCIEYCKILEGEITDRETRYKVLETEIALRRSSLDLLTLEINRLSEEIEKIGVALDKLKLTRSVNDGTETLNVDLSSEHDDGVAMKTEHKGDAERVASSATPSGNAPIQSDEVSVEKTDEQKVNLLLSMIGLLKPDSTYLKPDTSDTEEQIDDQDSV